MNICFVIVKIHMNKYEEFWFMSNGAKKVLSLSTNAFKTKRIKALLISNNQGDMRLDCTIRVFLVLWDVFPKSTVAEFFLLDMRNVPLPFWHVSTIPNTIFGIRGGEERRRRVRVRWPSMSVFKQTSSETNKQKKKPSTTLSSTKNGHKADELLARFQGKQDN